MIIYDCFLEIYSEEKQQWLHVVNPHQPTENDGDNEFFNTVNREHLFIFFKGLENQKKETSKIKWLGIPENASPFVRDNYNQVFEDIVFCDKASYLDLAYLENFTYNDKVAIDTLPKRIYKRFQGSRYQSKQSGDKNSIPFNEFLEPSYFEDLNIVMQCKGKCEGRIIYFADTTENINDAITEPQRYFRSHDIPDSDVTAEDYRNIQSLNHNILSYFVVKTTAAESEENIAQQEILGIKIRDLFLEYLKQSMQQEEYQINQSRLPQRLSILEKIVVFGYHTEGTENEALVDFLSPNLPSNQNTRSSKSRIKYPTDETVVIGDYCIFTDKLTFYKFLLKIQIFRDKYHFEIQLMNKVYKAIAKKESHDDIIFKLQHGLDLRKTS